MRAPLSWFTDVLRHGDPAWSATAVEVDAGFVRVGFEIEDVEPFPEITGPLIVGRVEAIEELTEFKKPIRFCQVDVGEEQPRGIVCGARNFAEGDLIVAALPGVVLPGPFAIAARKTYGKTSDGMICSVAEMGIGADASGILVLAPGTAEPGADAREVLGLADTAIDINVTPDRGYAFSVRGLGRELAGSFGVPFVDPGAGRPTLADDGSRDAWPVAIEPDSAATRYTARVITGVDAAAVSPWWMQKRLLVAGIRPISAIVDITNYVMIELGQPLHAFDADKITGTITVRSAASGETLTTLDGAERALDPEDVVIADESGPIALAGKVEWYELTIEPGGELASDAHEEGAKEHLSVQAGSLVVQVGGSSQTVRRGETVRYVANVQHAIANSGKAVAKAILVVEYSSGA